MVKVVLKGTPNTQYQLEKSMVAAGTKVELNEAQLKIAKKHNLIDYQVSEDINSKTHTPFKPSHPQVSSETYTKKGLFAMNKAEQVEIIKGLGLVPAGKEEDRVNQILEAQK